tara:strand:+ start:509 stop:1246 length:738 start_codon:yes stop_codon:yes gene_type:complete
MNNKDMGKKYFETRKDSLEDSVKNIFGNTISSEQNKFNEAAKAATDAGKEYFVVNGLQHKTPVAEAKEVTKEITDKQKKLPKALQAAIKKKEDGEKEVPKGSHRMPDGSIMKDDDKSMKEDSLDKVNPKAVKKKFDDRKDKDIDNDGDVDSSDKFLHKRRKAISKAVKNEEKSIVDIQQEKNLSMREMLAKIWGIDEGKSPFATKEEAPKKKSGKTESGEKATEVKINPELAPVVQTQIVPNADR